MDVINNARVLDNDQLRRFAPSIFAVAPHDSRSERFMPIPTIRVIDALRREGFFPVSAKQSNTRDVSRVDFTKHMITLRRQDPSRKYQVGDTVFEIWLKNANDGTASYELGAGLFRIRCLNGLRCDLGSIGQIRVKHMGKDIPHQVVEGTYKVLEASEVALAAPQDWSRLPLPKPAADALAAAAHTLRFGDSEQGKAIEAARLLHVRRPDDRQNDLWTGFNVVQENIVRGGITARMRTTREDAQGRTYQSSRRTTTRDVNGIDQEVRLNKALWLVGAQLAKTLQGSAIAA